MAFWSSPTLDPKRQFKFRVKFNYLDGDGTRTDSTFLAQSADRPVYSISDTAQVHYLDKQFYFPGKVTWNEVKIKFVDAIGIDTVNVSKRSYEFLTLTGWVSPPDAGPQVGAAQMKTISKERAVNRTRNVSIDVLDSDGNPVDQWTLMNAFVKTVSLSPLDYKGEDILTAEYTFRYDWANYGTTQFR